MGPLSKGSLDTHLDPCYRGSIIISLSFTQAIEDIFRFGFQPYLIVQTAMVPRNIQSAYSSNAENHGRKERPKDSE